MTERLFATARTTEFEQKCSGSCKHKLSIDSAGSADRIMQLQRTAGNHAVQKLVNSGFLQAKLTVSEHGMSNAAVKVKVSVETCCSRLVNLSRICWLNKQHLFIKIL